MATTFELIAKSVLVSSASSVDFTSIPTTYTDLKLVYSARSSATGTWYSHRLTFNGTAYNSNWSQRGLYGTGSATGSESYSNSEFVFTSSASATGSTFANGEIYVPNYLSSNYKSVSADMVSENNGTAAIAYLEAALWSNTAAINQLTITTTTGTFDANSSFYLYGIKNS